jgi:hypothetical protein
VLLAASAFYASLKLQILYSSVRGDPYLLANDWSAPLDDVFIHFDFARQTARGRPFEWSPGNGYSSGGTSLLYPFILAPGFWLGFRGGNIMGFAALVACISIFAALLATRRLFRSLPSWTAFLAPPLVLSVGALDWSLFSGMEVAFFLSMWALALVFWDDLVNGVPGSPPVTATSAVHAPWRNAALTLGVANALVVATRPEALTTAAVFSVSAAWTFRTRIGARAGVSVFVRSIGFALVVLVAQATANKLLTGDFSAAGALVKLEMNDPRLTAREAWESWLFFVRYQVGRVTGHHLGDSLWVGSLLWVLAALAVAFRKTRFIGLVLWAQAVSWVLVVALNGQVRWQNDRYTMPALAWMLLAAAVGVGAAVSQPFDGRVWVYVVGDLLRARAASTFLGRVGRAVDDRARRVIACVLVGAALVALGVAQVPQFRDQIWFFGRASRNIRDQHVKVGRIINDQLSAAHRVLVGDAGAIPFSSDMPALDIIGLGGYHDLPFARAGRWGVGAAIELIERIPPASRPDLMAIYPNWWGDFPIWFGVPLDGVSVRGNVICGGLTKMLYAARWNALDIEQKPITGLGANERLVDAVDFADIISEKSHAYRIDGALGFVAMRLLTANGEKPRELWDAGRVTFPTVKVAFVLKGFSGGHAVRLLLRTAPARPEGITVKAGASAAVKVDMNPTDSWLESSVLVPPDAVTKELPVTITTETGEVVLFHLWATEAK